MESLYFLVPCALIFIGLAIKVMFWAINNGQYDNLDTEAHRILFDADKTPKDAASAAPDTLANTSDDTSDNKNPHS